jgi:hypothetical protein
MKKGMAALMGAIPVLAWPLALAAHHSLVQFDTTTPVWIRGTVVRFDPVTPHARIYLDQSREDGQMQRWAVDGPPANRLAQMRINQDFLKPGDVVEVCGFPLKEAVASQRAIPQPGSTPSVLSGQPFSGHVLVMPNGKRRFWSDYGVLEKCLLPGESKEALREEAFGRRF